MCHPISYSQGCIMVFPLVPTLTVVVAVRAAPLGRVTRLILGSAGRNSVLAGESALGAR